MGKFRIVLLKRKLLVAVGCLAAALVMCWVAASPEVVGAAATGRQLPIYCVEKDYKVVPLSFDAAWGDAKVRQPVGTQWLQRSSIPPLFCHYHTGHELILQEASVNLCGIGSLF